jgi:hypothetical protein
VYPFSAESLLAERVGFGANARGGDPDAVYRVSSRANSGPGTLRDALESQDSLWIVFDVEGEIDGLAGGLTLVHADLAGGVVDEEPQNPLAIFAKEFNVEELEALGGDEGLADLAGLLFGALSVLLGHGVSLLP